MTDEQRVLMFALLVAYGDTPMLLEQMQEVRSAQDFPNDWFKSLSRIALDYLRDDGYIERTFNGTNPATYTVTDKARMELLQENIA